MSIENLLGSEILAQAIGSLTDLLQSLSSQAHQLHDAYADLRQQLEGGGADFPAIEILPSDTLAGANGAYAAQTNTIYLAHEFVTQSEPQAIVGVLLEEVGHWLNAKTGADLPGDEGALFAKIARGEPISDRALRFLQAEDDTATVLINGQPIQIEQSVPYEGTNLNQLREGLNDLLDALQDALESEVFANGLPLVGDTLKDSANEAVQFITQLRTSINDTLDDLTNPNVQQIRDAIADALNTLGVLPDVNGDGEQNGEDIEVLESADDVQFSLRLDKAFTAFSAPLAEQIGLPNLGLSVSGSAATALDYGFDLTFGMNRDQGFYLDTAASDELSLGVDLDPTFEAAVKLGFFDFEAIDQGSQFNGSFAIDLTDLPDGMGMTDEKLFLAELTTIGTNYENLLDAKLGGGADIQLALKAGTNIEGLPSLQTNFGLKWNFDPTALVDPDQPDSFGLIPEVSFGEVQLDLDAFLSQFIAPILDGVNEVLGFAPLQKLLGVLNTDLPVIGVTLLKIAETFSSGVPPGTSEFVDDLAAIANFATAIDSISGESILIPLGEFALGADDDPRQSGFTLSDADPDNIVAEPNPSDELPSEAADFFSDLKDVGLAFPIFDDPTKAFGLLLGRNEDLFTYTTPQLTLGLTLPLPPIPVPPLPLHIDFSIEAIASAQLQFGYDAAGLIAFQASGYTDADRIFDGFFVDNPAPGLPVFNLYAGITGEAVAEGGIVALSGGGTIGGNVGLGLPERLRLNQAPGCLFELSGDISASLFAAFRVGFGPFSYKQKFTLARLKLVDFRAGCTADNSDRNLATPGAGGNLAVSAGVNQGNLIGITGASPDEIFVIGHVAGGLPNETVSVAAYDVTNTYENVASIFVDSFDGNDIIIVETGVLAPTTLLGGEGDDELQGGNGGDTIDGGSGDDILSGGSGNDTIRGAIGDDVVVGGGGSDALDGGAGINTVSYAELTNPLGVTVNLATATAIDGSGTDTLQNFTQVVGSGFGDRLTASSAGSVLDGGGGSDRLLGGTGDDFLLGGVGADQMDGGGGTNGTSYIYSTAGVLINLLSGKGSKGDAQGDQLTNIQSVQGSNLNDQLIGNGFDNRLDGASGDDRLSGGAGADVLDGGAGEDWARYNASPDAVNVSLREGSGRGFGILNVGGGDGRGDQLLLTADRDNNPATVYSSIENLEGSARNDILAGDSGRNILKGGQGDDTLRGDDGDDTLIGGANADTHDGGGGFDWADYSDSALAVNVNLQAGVGTEGDADGDTFVQSVPGTATVENLIGSDRADTLVGDDGVNEIDPGYSSFGVDTAIGGASVDRLIIDYSNNAGFNVGSGVFGGYFNGSADAGFISRNTSDNFTTLDAVSFSEMERLLLIGTAFNDNIFSGAGDDLLVMGAGNDVVLGGQGSNSIFAGEGNDDVTDQNDAFGEFGSIAPVAANNVINLDGGTGVDALSIDLRAETEAIVLESTNPLVESNQQFSSGDGAISIRNFERFRLIYTGDGSDRLTQLGRVDNDFSTGEGDDVVNAGLGIDIVDGGFDGGESGGDDLLIVDYSVEDVGSGMVAEISGFNASNGGRYYRNTSDGETLLDQVSFDSFERFQITGTSQADQIYGGDFEDVLSGNAGSDFIIGNFGADQISGGDDSDLLLGNFGNDSLSGGEGDDTLVDRLNISDYLASGSGNDFMDGGNGNDSVDGGIDDDQLFGGAGDDFLVGGLASDALAGGDGNDTLIGINYGASQFPGEFPNDNPQQFFQIDTLTGNAGADRFWLGDGTYVYYDDGARSSPGLENYALITDFNPGEGDVIQLHGTQSEYVLGAAPAGLPTGIGIYRPEPFAALPSELIGIVQGATDLNLAASYFAFV